MLSTKEIAPAVVRALPRSDELPNKWIGPLATIVPRKTEPIAKSNCPPICQYTLHKEAERTKLTFEDALSAKAPPILIINTASGLSKASKVNVPFNVEAAFVYQTPGVRVWPPNPTGILSPTGVSNAAKAASKSILACAEVASATWLCPFNVPGGVYAPVLVPTSPVTIDAPVFVIAPAPVNIAKPEAAPKLGAVCANITVGQH